MASTVRDIVTLALQRIGSADISEEAQAEDIAPALDAYNALHAEAQADGLLETWVDQGLNDTPTLGGAYHQPLAAAVGERFASIHSRPVPMDVMKQARQFRARLSVAVMKGEKADFENGFYRIRPGRGYINA